MLPSGFLITGLAYVAITTFLIYILMFLSYRFVHRFVAISIGILPLVHTIYTIVSQIIYCNAEPEWIPSLDGSEGRFLFTCDSIYGFVSYLYIYFIGPIHAVLIAHLIRWFWTKPDRDKGIYRQPLLYKIWEELW